MVHFTMKQLSRIMSKPLLMLKLREAPFCAEGRYHLIGVLMMAFIGYFVALIVADRQAWLLC